MPFDALAIGDVEGRAGKAQGGPIAGKPAAALRRDPARTAVVPDQSIFLRERLPGLQGGGDGRSQAGEIIRMDAGEEVGQRRTALGQGRRNTVKTCEAGVGPHEISRHVPIPRADPLAGRQRLFEPLAALFERALAAPLFGDVMEQDRDLTPFGLADAEGMDMEQTPHGLGPILEARGHARGGDAPIGLEPMRLEVRHEVARAPPNDIREPALPLEGVVDHDEAVVDRPLALEFHLDDREPGVECRNQRAVKRFEAPQRLGATTVGLSGRQAGGAVVLGMNRHHPPTETGPSVSSASGFGRANAERPIWFNAERETFTLRIMCADWVTQSVVEPRYVLRGLARVVGAAAAGSSGQRWRG